MVLISSIYIAHLMLIPIFTILNPALLPMVLFMGHGTTPLTLLPWLLR